jgi:hypothetical protein
MQKQDEFEARLEAQDKAAEELKAEIGSRIFAEPEEVEMIEKLGDVSNYASVWAIEFAGKYTATAVYTCGEIVEVYDVEAITPNACRPTEYRVAELEDAIVNIYRWTGGKRVARECRRVLPDVHDRVVEQNRRNESHDRLCD